MNKSWASLLSRNVSSPGNFGRINVGLPPGGGGAVAPAFALNFALNGIALPIPAIKGEVNKQNIILMSANSQGSSNVPVNPTNASPQGGTPTKPSREEQQTDGELIRSRRSLQKQIQKHLKKLADYIQDPYAQDNLGILKRASTPQKKQEIVLDRIKHLNDEIRAFENKIKKINIILASRRIP